MVILTEKIAVLGPALSAVEIVAANVHYPMLTPIPSKQCIAKHEETRVGHAIILKNDCLLTDPEGPVETRHDPIATAKV
jgi:hypothetical protein